MKHQTVEGRPELKRATNGRISHYRVRGFGSTTIHLAGPGPLGAHGLNYITACNGRCQAAERLPDDTPATCVRCVNLACHR